jgi:hypothetical protein
MMVLGARKDALLLVASLVRKRIAPSTIRRD